MRTSLKLIILLQCLILFSCIDIAAAENTIHIDYSFSYWDHSWSDASLVRDSHIQSIPLTNIVAEQRYNDNKLTIGLSLFRLKEFDYIPDGIDSKYTGNCLRYNIKAGYCIHEPLFIMLGYFNHSLEIAEGTKAGISGVSLSIEGDWRITDEYSVKASAGASLFGNIVIKDIVDAESNYLWAELMLMRNITDDIFLTAGYTYEHYINNLSSLSLSNDRLRISGINIGVSMLFR